MIDFIVVFFAIGLAFYFGWSLRIGLIRVLTPLTLFVVGFAFCYLLDESSLEFSLIKLVGLTAILIAGYFIKYLYDVKFHSAIAKRGIVKAIKLLLLDFRVAAVFIGLLVSIFLSFPFYELAIHEAANSAVTKTEGANVALAGFWLSFFTSWISSVLFFAVVGLVAGLTALYRPETDVFAARVQILLGGKSGPAVDYIAQKLGEIGYVARLTERKVFVEEYSEEMKAFKLKVIHTSYIRNLYHDQKTDAVGKISLRVDPLEPEPQEFGRLTSFRINGVGQPDLPLVVTKEGALREWAVSIPGDDEGVVSYEHWSWYRDDTEHGFTLGRFTELLEFQITVRCRIPDKRIKLKLTAGTSTTDNVLDYDEMHEIDPIKDQFPGTVAYSYRLEIE